MKHHSPDSGAGGAAWIGVKRSIRAGFWGFFWGYVAAFALCLTVLVIGMGARWPGLDGVLDIGGHVFFSSAQYVFLGVGVIVALFRAYYADMDEETRNQDDLEACEEMAESLWDDRSE